MIAPAAHALRSRLPIRQRLLRARRIGLTAGRIYVGAKANQLIEAQLAPVDMPARWDRFGRDSARAVLAMAIDLRGLILKASQFLGSRPDLLPDAVVDVLSTLQDRVPPCSFETMQAVVENELGAPLATHFSWFAHESVGAASLAQVHEARLITGERVAVKIQYPEIETIVRTDLADLRRTFAAIGWLERDLDLSFVIEELSNTIPAELDFVAEGKSAERIAEQLAGRDDFAVPRIHHQLSSRRVLVMDFVDGIKISDVAALRNAGVDLDLLMQSVVEIYCEQILHHGFFHADPHPGNLMVRPGPTPGSRAQVTMIDFGLTKQLPDHFREGVVTFASALLSGRREGMADALEALGFETRQGGKKALEQFASIILDAATLMQDRSGADRNTLLEHGREIARLARENPLVRMPTHIVFLGRSLALLSGLAKTLGVRVDMLKTILPYALGGAPRPRPGSRGGRAHA